MKKIYFVILLLCALKTSAQTFTQKTNFPGGYRFKVTSVINGQMLYVGCGISDAAVMNSEWWKYNTTTDLWTQMNDIPCTIRRNAIACTINNVTYFGLGYDGTSKNDWWQYDDANDTWTQKNNFPGDERYWASMFEYNGKGYLVGGEKYNGSYTDYDEVWEYVPSTDAWTLISNIPTGVRCQLFSQVVDSAVYLGLGEAANTTYYSDMFRFDLINHTWSNMTPIPPTTNVPVADGPCYFSAAFNNKLVLINVNINAVVPDDNQTIYIYDIATDSWTLYPLANTSPFRLLHTTGQVGNKGYLGMGYDGVSVWYDDMWEINLLSVITSAETSNPDLKNITVTSSSHNMCVNIPTELLAKGNIMLDLFSMDGKKLKQFTLTGNDCLNVNTLATGAYVYMIKSNERTLKSGKVMIN